jgi:hypothetical protein
MTLGLLRHAWTLHALSAWNVAARDRPASRLAWPRLSLRALEPVKANLKRRGCPLESACTSSTQYRELLLFVGHNPPQSQRQYAGEEAALNRTDPSA